MYRAFALMVLTLVACGDEKHAPPRVMGTPPMTIADARVNPTAAFWKWFTENAVALRFDKDLRQTMERIRAQLEKVNSGVFAEIGKQGDNRTLVLTADGKKDLFPIVQELYASRPTVEGWAIVAFRPRGDLFLRVELGGHKIDPRKVKFVAAPTGSKLDIRVFVPGFTTKEEMGQIAFVFLDHVVGEYDMEMKIGGIEFASDKQAPATAKPISELPATVDALK